VKYALVRSISLCVVLTVITTASADGPVHPAPPNPDGYSMPSIPAPQPHPIPAPRFPAPPKEIVLTAASVEVDKAVQEKTREIERLEAEIKRLREQAGPPVQVLVRVKLMEVSLTRLRQIATDLPASKDGLNLSGVESIQKMLNSKVAAYTEQKAGAPAGNGASEFVDWLLQNRIAKVSAEPTLVTVSGRPASFFVGGEIPLPSRTAKQSAVEFQKFGTEVDVLAIAKDKERVRLELRARISEIDNQHSLTVNESKVPSLTVRACDTAIETTFGKTVVLDGMVETRVEARKTEEGVKTVDNQILTLFVVTPELFDADLAEKLNNDKTSR
jgi:Flp pilus assembly secretin CpaC